MTTKPTEARRRLEQLRVEWRRWRDCRGLHLDYCLAPGTDEGDAATAYRRDRMAEIEAQAKALLHNHRGEAA